MHCPQWVETRMLNKGNYQVKLLGSIENNALLLVEKSTKFTSSQK
jgi:hypothetical protein